MPDQWDPKWPGEKGKWEDEYEKARISLAELNNPWTPLLATIREADTAMEFKHLRAIYENLNQEYDLWTWRWPLWEMYCVPMFDKPQAGWLDYVTGVSKAVQAWPAIGGIPRGIPASWQGNSQKIWAFRATVTLIGGHIEGEL
jgi:hypothetical protein